MRPLKTELCTFGKTSAKATGAVGVLTYDMFERQSNDFKESIAIMFSVPYDYHMYQNWFAVGIFDKGKECNEALYKAMYYDKEPKGFVREKAVGSTVTYEGEHLDIKAGMSPLGRSIMKVELWDKLFSPPRSQGH